MEISRRQAISSSLALIPAVGFGATAALAAQEIRALAPAIVAAAREAHTLPLTPELRERLVWTVLDNIGVILFAQSESETRRVARIFAQEGSGADLRIPGAMQLSKVDDAAAALAYYIHSAEIDDGDLRSQVRASAVIMSSAIAMAVTRNLTGDEFLRALAIGYTVQGRMGAAAGPIQGRGWMASAWWGPPSAALQCALMMNLDERATLGAFALGATSVGGPFQYFFDQSEEKRILVARAARSGVESALLGQAGLEAANGIIDGRAGLYRLLGLEPPTQQALLDGFAEREGVLMISPKFIAASQSISPLIEALESAGFEPNRPVRQFWIGGNQGWERVLGSKINDFTPPDTRIGGMTNLSFVLARFMLGKSLMPDGFEPQELADRETLALAATGTFVSTSGGLSVRVEYRDGGHIDASLQENADGQQRPLDRSKRIEKFMKLAELGGLENSDRLMSEVQRLPETQSVSEWWSNILMQMPRHPISSGMLRRDGN